MSHLSSCSADVVPDKERTGDITRVLGEPFDEAGSFSALRRAETTGRRIGASGWLKALEERTGRALSPGKWGRKPQQKRSE